MDRVRCGVVACPVWRDLEMEGEYLILVHWIRTEHGVLPTAAYTRYNGELTNITDKFRTLKITPDWRERMVDRNAIVQALSDRLSYKTDFLSSINTITKYQEFGDLLRLGDDTVRYILSQMYWHYNKVFWFALLHQITGANPVPPEERGQVDQMRQRWVEWGMENYWFGSTSRL